MFLKETREFVGRAGLVHLDFKPVPDVELGVFLLKPYSGKGYATELCEAFTKYAFEILKSPRVFATVDPSNIASGRICEKIGMKFEKKDIYSTLNKTVRYYVKSREQV